MLFVPLNLPFFLRVALFILFFRAIADRNLDSGGGVFRVGDDTGDSGGGVLRVGDDTGDTGSGEGDLPPLDLDEGRGVRAEIFLDRTDLLWRDL